MIIFNKVRFNFKRQTTNLPTKDKHKVILIVIIQIFNTPYCNNHSIAKAITLIILFQSHPLRTTILLILIINLDLRKIL